MAAQGKSSSRAEKAGEYALYLVLAIILILPTIGILTVIGMGLYSIHSAYLARGSQEKLDRGTAAAYEGTVRVDVELAKKALAKGDLETVEERAFRAKAKLQAPQAAGQPIGQAAEELQSLEMRHGASLKPIRRRKERD